MARMVGVLVLASHEGDVSDFGHDVCKTHFVLRDLKGGRPKLEPAGCVTHSGRPGNPGPEILGDPIIN